MTFTSPASDYPVLPAVGWALFHSSWQIVAIWALHCLLQSWLRSSVATVRYATACAALMMSLAAGLLTVVAVLTGWSNSALWTIGPNGFLSLIPVAKLSAAQSDLLLAIDRILPTAVLIWGVWLSFRVIQTVIAWLRLTGLVAATSPIPQADLAAFNALARQITPLTDVRFVESMCITVPATVGWLRPFVILPVGLLANLNPAQVEAIVAHELAHIRRRDFFVNTLQVLLESIFWFHPLLWRISRDVRNIREECCDEIAISAIGGHREFYGNALLDVDAWRPPHRLAMGATAGVLEHRIDRVIANASTSSHLARLIPSILVGLVILASVCLAGRLAARDTALETVVASTASDSVSQVMYRQLKATRKNSDFVPAVELATAELQKSKLDRAAALRLARAIESGGDPSAMFKAAVGTASGRPLDVVEKFEQSNGGKQWDSIARTCFEYARSSSLASDQRLLVRAALLVAAQDRLNAGSYLYRLAREPDFPRLSGMTDQDVVKVRLAVSVGTQDTTSLAIKYRDWSVSRPSSITADLLAAMKGRLWLQWLVLKEITKIEVSEPSRAEAIRRSARDPALWLFNDDFSAKKN